MPHSNLGSDDPLDTLPDQQALSDPGSADDSGPAVRSRAVGSESVRGAAWVILFSMAGRVVALGLRFLALAILFPDDLGVVGLAATVTSLAIVSSGGLQTWLVRRTKSFFEDSGQVFWLSTVLGVGMAIVLAVVSPIAGLVYGQPDVTYVILISAAGIAIASLPTVYYAYLQYSLRFRSLAAVHFSRLTIEAVLMLILAKQGWGAYAIVVPQAVIGFYAVVAARLTAGRLELGLPMPSKWWLILGPTIWLMVFGMFRQARNSAPYFAAGMFHSVTITGYLTVGSTVVVQSVWILASGLQGVFFSALSKLNAEPDRQYAAAIRGMQTLLVVIIPVCLLQTLLAGPIIDVFVVKQWLPQVAKWRPSVPVIEWLSLGMISQPILVLALAVLTARGRFRLLAYLMAASTAAVLVASLFGSWIGAQTEIAICVAVALFATNTAIGVCSYYAMGRTWGDFVRTVWPPLVPVIPIGLLGHCVSIYTANWGIRWQIGCVILSVSIGYGLFVRFWLPEMVADIFKRLKGNPDLTQNNGAGSLAD